MKKEKTGDFILALCMFAAFILWTAAVLLVDRQRIGPLGSSVGLASINRFVHNLTGVHMSLHTFTDWLGLIPLIVVAGFAVLGLVQWITRKDIFKVDYSILVLGGFYAAVLAAYLFFEVCVVNYRPVLIDGVLEASYPSSTTMLVMCVMPTAAMQFRARMKNSFYKRSVTLVIAAFVVFMVTCRLISGVHWFTDIVGGALLSAGLVLLYRAIIQCKVR